MTDPRPELQWTLRARMQHAGIASIAELHRRLDAERVLISQVQLGRLVQAIPTRLNIPVLEALCRVLQCAPGDLLCWNAPAPPALLDSERPSKRTRQPAYTSEQIQGLVGPRFKLHSRERPK